MSAHEKKLQEAKFELITSEASYVKSLNVLEKHFMNSPQFRDETVLSKGDRQILFSRVNPGKLILFERNLSSSCNISFFSF